MPKSTISFNKLFFKICSYPKRELLHFSYSVLALLQAVICNHIQLYCPDERKRAHISVPIRLSKQLGAASGSNAGCVRNHLFTIKSQQEGSCLKSSILILDTLYTTPQVGQPHQHKLVELQKKKLCQMASFISKEILESYLKIIKGRCVF